MPSSCGDGNECKPSDGLISNVEWISQFKVILKSACLAELLQTLKSISKLFV